MGNQLKKNKKARLLRFVFYLAIICPVIGVFSSCDQMTDNYQQFMEGGEIIYPGKPDSVKVYPGKYRVGLSWLIKSDPSITSAKIYWNNSNDSTTVPISRTSGIDTITVVIDNLLEQSYSFNVITIDALGNRSVNAEVIGPVYGDKYRSTLLNRAISDITFVEGEGLNITWITADEGTVGEDIKYKDKAGNIRTVSFDVGLGGVLLEEYNPSQSYFSLSTTFIPDSMAIDTFKTAYEQIDYEVKKTEKEVDRSTFSLFPLPGDYTEPHNASGFVSQIWTNELALQASGTYLSLVNGHEMPQWFTIDMGAEFDLSKMKLFQRGSNSGSNATRLYAGGNLAEFEVWGSLDPDPNYNPDEHNGDFGDSWVLLQTCTVIRPSGNFLGSGSTRSDNTEEDLAAAEAGHEYNLENAENIRYVRIKATKNWDALGRGFVNIGAVGFWAIQY